MPFPVKQEDVEQSLTPYIGEALTRQTSFAMELTQCMRAYSPYRQTLMEFREQLERFLITGLSRLTRGSMSVVDAQYRRRYLLLSDVEQLSDNLMGLLFDGLTPVAASFIRLNDYSLHVYSPSALRVLCQKYKSFYSREEYAFMLAKIREFYSPEIYRDWLPETPASTRR